LLPANNEIRRVAAVPPDVRKGFAFPKDFFEFSLGYALRGAEPRFKFSYAGKPEAFRTSGGRAAKHAGGTRTASEHFRYWFSLICLEVGESNLAKILKKRKTNLMTIQRILVVLLGNHSLSIHYSGERFSTISRKLSANDATTARRICCRAGSAHRAPDVRT
jgi:hypothetical protein